MGSEDKFEFCEADSPLRSAFDIMYRNGELIDVTVKCGDKDFHGHRMVLAGTFPYFRILFARHMLDNNMEDEIILGNIDPEAFKCLWKFAYTGRIRVAREKVKKLLIAANCLQHTKIRDVCFEFLSGRFTPENVLDLRTLGNTMNCYEFAKKADSFISENFELLRKTQEFLNAPYELLMEIVSRNDLVVKKTENVYKAISKWLKADTERTDKFMELVMCVQKQLPLPLKRCASENEMNGPPKKIITRTLLDMPYYYEDVFGIYTVSSSASYNRIVYNYNCYSSTWWRITENNEPRSFTTVVSACGLIFAFTGENLEFFDRHSWTICGVLPWEVRSRSGNAVTRGKEIYWFPNVSDKDCSVWCFNVVTQEWREQATSVKLISAGLVFLGWYIYVLGGYTSNGVTDAAMTYDPYYEEFRYISPMLERRSSSRCAALNEKVYVCGGYGSRSSFLDSAEVYDPLKEQWQYITPMRKKWSNFSIVPCEGKLFLIGKQEDEDGTMEIYDPDKDVWESGTDFPDRCISLKTVVIST